MQHDLLPRILPQIDGWEMAAEWKPVQSIGGDYFDAIRFGPGRVGLCIADVMGKGLPAALMMSHLQAVVRSVASDEAQPAEVCAAVNRAMSGNLDEGRFVSFLYCALDAAAGRLTWSNAGHNPGIVQRLDGSSVTLADGGTVLGLFADAVYTQGSIPIAHGDRIVMYTDGITEAIDASGQEFGHEQLARCVARHGRLAARPLCDTIFQTVAGFCGGQFADDATLIVLAAAESRPRA